MNNIAVGTRSLNTNTDGVNIAIGYEALKDNVDNSNIAIGYKALTSNSSNSATPSIAIGNNTLQNTTESRKTLQLVIQ